jgi:hypothetical protein
MRDSLGSSGDTVESFATLFQHYLWLFVLGILLLNIVYGYTRAGSLVSSGRITQQEREDFTRGAVLWSAGYCLVQEGILVLSHAPSPLCLLQFPPHSYYGTFTWIIAAGTVALLLTRLWQDKGIDLLVRIGPAFVQQGFLRGVRVTPRQVQILLTAILLLALAFNVSSGPERFAKCTPPQTVA